MTYPIVELAFWNPGDSRSPAIDALIADSTAPLAKHGLTGLAAAYSRETGAPLDDTQRCWVNQMALKSMAVDGALSGVVPALERANIPYFVAKGPTIAYVDYPDPSMRPYTDLDVYVPSYDRPRALAALRGLGYTPVAQAEGPLGGQGCELHGGPFGAVVEVHGSVVDNLHRRCLPDVDVWMQYVRPARVNGLDLPVLSDAAHLALQAIHLGAGHRFQKLILLRDIARAGWFPERGEVVSDLGAAPALRTIQQVIQHLGQPVRESGATRIERAVARRLAMTDPQQWDEFAPTTENGMAVLVGARGRVAPQLALRIGTNVLRRRSAHLAARTPA